MPLQTTNTAAMTRNGRHNQPLTETGSRGASRTQGRHASRLAEPRPGTAYVRLGRAIRYLTVDIEEFLTSNRHISLTDRKPLITRRTKRGAVWPQTYTDLQATALDEDAVSELLTVQDAARFLNVTVSWVYEHARTDAGDRLPVIKVGKYLRFDRRDLRAYIDAKRATAQRPPPTLTSPPCQR